jgi:hypothetical protein
MKQTSQQETSVIIKIYLLTLAWCSILRSAPQFRSSSDLVRAHDQASDFHFALLTRASLRLGRIHFRQVQG